MRPLLLLAVSLACSLAAPAHAQPNDRQRVASQIVSTVEPVAIGVQTEMRGWEAGMRASLAKDPMIAKLETEHPGTIAAGLVGGRPIAQQYLEAAVARIQAKKIEALADSLTIEELNEFAAFVNSSAGRKFFRSMHANVSPETAVSNMMDRAERTGEREITKADAEKALRRTLEGVQKDLTAAETLAIMKFEQSSAGQKLIPVNAEIQKFALQTANSPDPDYLSRQSSAIMAAMIAFIEGKAAKAKP